MDFSGVNRRLIEEINLYLNNEKDVISFLEDSLNIGKQSVYRRLRGEIPFTFNEVITISLNLGISIDGIIGEYNPKGTFLELYLEKNLDKVAQSFAEDSLQLVKEMSNAKESSLTTLSNRLPMAFTMDFEYITRFKYYKAIHQQQKETPDLLFSDLKLPEELNRILKNVRHYYKHINTITIILDNNSFLSLIKEITYFYRRNLITDEELQRIKTEFYELLDQFEKRLIYGMDDIDQKFYIYISTLNIEANYSYFHFDNKENIRFWPYAEIPMVIQDHRVSLIQKGWLDSVKKYAVLVTQSNEIQRSAYIAKQKEYINNIGQESIL